MAVRRIGPFDVRETQAPGDIDRAQALRAACFGLTGQRDLCPKDPQCTHILIEARNGGALLGCLRLQVLFAREVQTGYAARHYDLARLAGSGYRMLEIGRVCVSPQAPQADVLRVAWQVLAAQVRQEQVGLIFGCTSFSGTDPQPYRNALSLLHAHHRAPPDLGPGRKAAQCISLADFASPAPCTRAALREMPGLMRSYLGLGAWVSDHAVVDRHLGRLHVFTALQARAIPPTRQGRFRILE